jgi:hypothetical protein
VTSICPLALALMESQLPSCQRSNIYPSTGTDGLPALVLLQLLDCLQQLLALKGSVHVGRLALLLQIAIKSLFLELVALQTACPMLRAQHP